MKPPCKQDFRAFLSEFVLMRRINITRLQMSVIARQLKLQQSSELSGPVLDLLCLWDSLLDILGLSKYVLP